MAWTIDPAHSTVGFSGKHLGVSTVRGQFKKFEADLDIPDDGDLSKASGRVTIDATSLDTGNEQRDAHLRSADFFDVETHPTITFEAKSLTPVGDDRYRVAGDLTIRGLTRPVTLELEDVGHVADPFGNDRIGGTLKGTISRGDWDLKWNMPLGGGGLLVSDKIKIEVDGELTKSKEAADQEATQEAGTVA